MSGLICTSCGGLLHVGLFHQCDMYLDRIELDRRIRRANRAEQRAQDPWFAPFVGVSYTVIPEPPRDMTPIRVQAYVGHRLAEIETRGQELIEGELA